MINHFLGWLQYIFGIKPLSVFVLCYHGIGDANNFYNVTVDNFRKQMDYLSTFTSFISLEQLGLYLDRKMNLSGPAVAITFDDGYQSVLQIREIIKKYNIKPAIFVISDPGKINRVEIENDYSLLNTKDIKTLIKDQWDIGSHSKTHESFAKLTKSKIIEEVIDSKSALSRDLGIDIKYFAYPKGVYSMPIVEAAKQAKYQLAFSMDDNPLMPGTDKLTISRIGINASHSLQEFKYLFTPWVQKMRKVLK